MAYTLIPNATDQLSVSQGDLLNNFTAADTIFAQNHGGFLANDGTHKFVQMPEQGSAPATTVDQGALYTAVGATSGVTEMVFRRENNGTTIPFTEFSNTGTFPNTIRGWTRLPSGIIMQWGAVGIVNPAGVAITFPIQFLTACFGVWVQEVTGGGVTHNWFQVINPATTMGVTITSKDGNGNPSAPATGVYFALGL